MNDTTGNDAPRQNPELLDATPPKILSPAAQRALAEAQARREAAQAAADKAAVEINGRGGLDPVRYGDWEVKGLTSDF
jgi:hypothetical protein